MSLTLEQAAAIRALALADAVLPEQLDRLAARLKLKPSLVQRVLRNMTSVPQLRRKTTLRTCLGCDGRFRSEHAGHRVCDGCKRRPAWRFAGCWG